MQFNTFGSIKKPKILLLHGALTPWQIWDEQIEAFKNNYYIIAPALDAHTQDEKSEFISIQDEAKKLEEYCYQNDISEFEVVCGISMGATIANILWGNNNIKINKLILDGAELTPTPLLFQKLFTKSYIDIIAKSKERNPKTLKSFKRTFLPKKHLDAYLKIADNISNTSIVNICKSVGNSRLCTNAPKSTKLLFIYGTSMNEYLAKKSAKLVKKHYPHAKLICLKGCSHCEYICFKPHKWTKLVSSFIIE